MIYWISGQYHAIECLIFSRSRYALPVGTTLIRFVLRCPTTLYEGYAPTT